MPILQSRLMVIDFVFINKKKVNKKTIIILIILALIGTAVFVYISNQKSISILENTQDLKDDRPFSSINPTPINIQNIRPVGESMLPPKITQEDIQKMEQDRNKKSLGSSLVEISDIGELTVPFTLGEQEVLLNASQYRLNEWISSSTFIFTDYGDKLCDFFCEGKKFIYDINTKTKITFIQNEWLVSPNKQFAVKYEQGTMKKPTEMLGVFYLKDMKNGEIRNLGKTVRGTGYDGSYTDSCLWAFTWSPDSQNIAMLDWCDYNTKVGGPAVKVLSAIAKNISERQFLGYTLFREIERSKNQELIFWSPDSTKLYAKDSNVVFDVIRNKELFRPDVDFAQFRSWSSDSEKIIAIADGVGFAVIDVVSGNTDGYLFIKEPILFQSQKVVWMPDGRHILTPINGYGKNYIYYLDTETRMFGRINETKAEESYNDFLVFPDTKNLAYIHDKKILLRSINWK